MGFNLGFKGLNVFRIILQFFLVFDRGFKSEVLDMKEKTVSYNRIILYLLLRVFLYVLYL